MTAFLLGVAGGWICTFALWFIWSFGPISGLLLGALIGVTLMIAFFMVQFLLGSFFKVENRSDISAKKTVRTDTEKAAFRS